VEKAQVFPKAATDTYRLYGFQSWLVSIFYLSLKTQLAQSKVYMMDDIYVRVSDAQDAIAVTAFRVKDARQESFAPFGAS
jgi:hypothetical protein